MIELKAVRNAERKRKRQHRFYDAAESLLNWFCSAREEKMLGIDGKMLLIKAQEFAHIYSYGNVDKLDIN